MGIKLSGESQAVVIKYGLFAVAGLLIYWQLKQGLQNAVDFVKDIDLNPFDSNGSLGLSLPRETLQISGSDPSHAAALAKLGADITKYRIYYPNPVTGQAMPKGTLQVKWGVNKITYYTPKTSLDAFLL